MNQPNEDQPNEDKREEDKRDDKDRNPTPGKQAPGAPPTDPVQAPGRPDPQGGIDREVGDLEDPDAEQDGALPGRVGGGLAGG